MKRKRTPSPDDVHPTSSNIDGVLQWLSDQGSKNTTLQFRSSKKYAGGMGVFTTTEIKPGKLIASIPQRCVLTATKALRSSFGQQCSAAIQDNPAGTDEFVLLLWMALGRKDTQHPFHAYLTSLPQTPSLPISWPRALTDDLATLGGTNLGTALEQYRDLVHISYASLVQDIRTKCPSLIPSTFQHEDVVWAHDNYLSRRFPDHLAVAMVMMAMDGNKKSFIYGCRGF